MTTTMNDTENKTQTDDVKAAYKEARNEVYKLMATTSGALVMPAATVLLATSSFSGCYLFAAATATSAALNIAATVIKSDRIIGRLTKTATLTNS